MVTNLVVFLNLCDLQQRVHRVLLLLAEFLQAEENRCFSDNILTNHNKF